MASTPAEPQTGFGNVLAARPERPLPTAPSGDAARHSGAAASTTLGATLERQVGALMDQEAQLDAAMTRASSGRPMDNRELLHLQATVYAYGQRVEVATRVVDRTAGAVRHLLNIQL